jgi:DNA processing protein
MAEGLRRGTHAAALVELPGCGPACLSKLLTTHSASEVWALIVSGDLEEVGSPDDRRRWRAHASAVDLDRLASDLERNGIVTTTHHDADHPAALIDDVDPAPVVFRRGDPVDSAAPAVAIVGTRRCTPTGREISEELGFGLAREGVVVVSGLALGIDGAAHRGALRASGAAPVAVVGSGIDVIYPRRNADLWRRIGENGALLSEAPLGTRPEPWRFPARNRLLAALADVVLVVESRAAGGSMITVEQAIRRGRPVLAVPGSIRNPAAAGTNLLIDEGCQPVCAVDDVLVALDLATAGPVRQLLTDEGGPVEPGVATGCTTDDPSSLEHRIVTSVDFVGTSLDVLSESCGESVGAVAAAVVTLEQRGVISLIDGLIRRRVPSEATGGGTTGTGCDPVPSTG